MAIRGNKSLPALGILAVLAFASALAAQDATDLLVLRFGYQYNKEKFPQNEPDVAMKSVVAAIDQQRLNYVLAHLTDPAHIDAQVEKYKADYPRGSDEGRTFLAFNKLHKQAEEHLLKNPSLLKEMRAFAEFGKWQVSEDFAVGIVPGLTGRRVVMRRFLGRWFLRNERALPIVKKEAPPEQRP